MLFALQQLAVAQAEADASGVTLGEALGQRLVRTDLDPPQQVLHVGGGDSLREVLLGQHLAVEQCDREQIGQRVVGLLLGLDLVL